MALALGIFNALLLAFISGIHFYWALGGKRGFELALPRNAQQQKMLNPKAIDCFLLALGLLAFSLFHLWSAQLFPLNLPTWLLPNGLWVISGIFFLRAVGDFRYVGFSKRIRNTDFARLDYLYYSPLCLLISLCSAGMALLG